MVSAAYLEGVSFVVGLFHSEGAAAVPYNTEKFLMGDTCRPSPAWRKV